MQSTRTRTIHLASIIPTIPASPRQASPCLALPYLFFTCLARLPRARTASCNQARNFTPSPYLRYWPLRLSIAASEVLVHRTCIANPGNEEPGVLRTYVHPQRTWSPPTYETHYVDVLVRVLLDLGRTLIHNPPPVRAGPPLPNPTLPPFLKYHPLPSRPRPRRRPFLLPSSSCHGQGESSPTYDISTPFRHADSSHRPRSNPSTLDQLVVCLSALSLHCDTLAAHWLCTNLPCRIGTAPRAANANRQQHLSSTTSTTTLDDHHHHHHHPPPFAHYWNAAPP